MSSAVLWAEVNLCRYRKDGPCECGSVVIRDRLTERRHKERITDYRGAGGESEEEGQKMSTAPKEDERTDEERERQATEMREALVRSEQLRNAYRNTPWTKPSNPKDNAATSRLQMSLFPQTAIAYGALAMTEGHCKYGGYNFREAGVLASVYVDACMRHLFKWVNGQNVDPKTQVPELASALACIAVIIDAFECGKLNDDRPPKAPLASLLESFEQKTKHLQQTFPDGPPRCVEKERAA